MKTTGIEPATITELWSSLK